MAEQIELSSFVQARLRSLGIDVMSLDNKTRRQISAIEQAVQTENNQREQAQSEVLKHRLTISNISKSSGIGRTTIYDNETLKAYVEDCQKADNDKTSRQEVVHLQQRVDALKKQVAAMEKRDGRIITLETENRQLKERVSRLEQLLSAEQQEQTQPDRKATVLSFDDYRNQKTRER